MTRTQVDISVKDILAKLMSRENLSVQHCHNAKTASFNLKNRELVLPIWKEMDDSLYNMLIGHEIGHALYTPAIQALEEMNATPGLASYINVIEDARIEKIIKNSFPGIRKCFREAYQYFFKEDFFGIKKKGIENFDLIDRINIHFKLDNYVLNQVSFSDDEKKWVERVDICKTFDDVVTLAKELYENQKSLNDQNQVIPQDQSSEMNQCDDQSNEMIESPDNLEFDDTADGTSNNGNIKASPHPDDTLSETNENLDDPLSKTDKNLQKKMQQFRDNDGRDYAYVNYPNLNKAELDNCIIPFQKVHAEIQNHYESKEPHEILNAKKKLISFRRDNIKVVNYLVKEFEMKKAAESLSKTKIAKTGVIDTNKLHSYKYNDDIFKRNSIIPQGKNHGLVILFDMSGSMSTNMPGAIEQMINLVLFCKKVQIPFEVYGFTNSGHYSNSKSMNSPKKINDIVMPMVSIRNYFSHRMNSAQLQTALVNMMSLIQYYEQMYQPCLLRSDAKYSLPPSEALGTTPLDEAIVITTYLVPLIQKKYNLQIMNCVFITDGQATSRFRNGKGEVLRGFQKVFITKDNIIYPTKTRDFTKTYLEILKKTCKTNNIGFFIAANSSKSDTYHLIRKKLPTSTSEISLLYKEYLKNGFLDCDEQGYDSFFIIPGDTKLRTKTEKISVKSNASPKKITNLFIKNQKNTLVNRVMLSRFIDLIT